MHFCEKRQQWFLYESAATGYTYNKIRLRLDLIAKLKSFLKSCWKLANDFYKNTSILIAIGISYPNESH